jgi:hypothetical protein
MVNTAFYGYVLNYPIKFFISNKHILYKIDINMTLYYILYPLKIYTEP